MENNKNESTAGGGQKKSKAFIFILAALVIGGGSFGASKYVHSLHHEETDDAQVDAYVSPIIPRISGYVAAVRVHDNQPVKKGDTLLIIDDRELKIKVEQARAAIAIAEFNLNAAKASTAAASANVATSRAAIPTVDAQIETAKINVWRATQDFNRYANLIKDHSITQQQYEQALAAKQTAEQQLAVLEKQKREAAQRTSAVISQSAATAHQVSVADATILQRKVELADAELNLSYTVLLAPEDGYVSRVNVQPGQFVNAGATLFSVVHAHNVWVVANFKETQLAKMKEGQKVLIKVDAHPDHTYEGVVASFSPATGARFAILPPDNASGNFVKVVQRVPVRIEFKADSLVNILRPGMNAVVDVHLD